MRTKDKGFTLVEILIVVVILGILAAIVIPQFSEASTEARLNSLQSNLQTMRSQLSLYSIQHNDTAPTSHETFTAQMTAQTNISGAVGTDFGPYLQSVPRNPFRAGAVTIAAADGEGVHWVYAGGRIYAGRIGLSAEQIALIDGVDPTP